MNRNVAILLSTLFFSSAILLFWKSGIKSDLIFEPISTIYSSSSMLSSILVKSLLAGILLAMGYAAIIASVIAQRKDSTLMLAVLIPLIITLGIYKNSIFGFFFMIGFALSVYVVINKAESEKELYKKLSVYNVAHASIKSGFFMISAFLALSVFVSFMIYPDLTEDVIKDSLSVFNFFTAGTNSRLAETQLQFMYDMLDSVETSMITASSIYMSPQCSSELSSMMARMDEYARESIRTNFLSSMNRTQENIQGSVLELIKNDKQTYDRIRKFMMFTVPLGVFAVLELFKSLLIAPLTAILARLLAGNAAYQAVE